MTVANLCRFLILLTLPGLLACGSQNDQQATSSVTQPHLIPQSSTMAGSFEDLELTAGQTIYVPAYAGIHFTAHRTINLTTTIGIHNTDLQESIIINSIQHYGGNGKLIKDYVQTPVRLAPMATTMFYVERSELQEGGLGANFIIEWGAEKDVHEPVVEAVMIGSAGNHGYSFISPGRVLSQK